MRYLIKLVKIAKPYWGYLIISAISLLILTGINLLGPWLIRSLIGIITNITHYPNAREDIIKISLVLVLSYILGIVFQFLRNYFSHYAAWHLVADVRMMVYDKLQNLSYRYFVDKQTGQLMSRVVNDTANLEMLIAHAVPDLISNLLILTGIATILFIINPTLAPLSLTPIPFLLFSSSLFAKKIMPIFRKAQKALADLNADLQDNLSGIREIQLFNKQEKEYKKIKEKVYNQINALLSALKLSAVFHPTVGFLSSLGNLIVVSIGGIMALSGKIQVQDIVGFLLYLGMFYQPINALAQILENVQQALAGAERVFEVLETEPEIKEKENAIELKDVKGKITFENVNFSYNPGVYVLKNISFEINPGEMVAFVGPTGVGKTTIMYLINRFFDPDSGSIKIDDIDIRDVTLKSLHENISIVLQDVFLFNGTVFENIAYGKENATLKEVIEAAKIAHAHEFIERLPKGYFTEIGERGIKLSGGQKQRLAIARAVLKNAPILILDEATSSVDTETESEIQKAINNLVGTRTILIIAHRLSTVKRADKIIVLKDGEIVEIGSHEELIKKKGLYYKLCSVQFAEDKMAEIVRN
ncbi:MULTISPECIES: ABC transporter ATP-binding protein [Dictyoglomus]|uniref:ABC transporter related n=1 Tax=Dictyoglomus turgidum (strain DSM 6724 / Z-1310) TaxID=515635 RepID=B8E1P8_DICTD|nr:ABC transporter ATP-binding protein [Dictyoglomus sp.]ACK41573.1 ABC transporter related [Dictyoglomus turgidum DSM 6724]HBU31708.1 ABC transporter ATP-binding protein [Dictyoglomus sp.]